MKSLAQVVFMGNTFTTATMVSRKMFHAVASCLAAIKWAPLVKIILS